MAYFQMDKNPIKELETEAEQFSEWLESQRYEVKALVETVNRRIAVVSI